MKLYYKVSIIGEFVSDIKFFVDDLLIGVLYPRGLKVSQVADYLCTMVYIIHENGEINNGKC